MKKVLVINSAKGGVGKTETAKGIALQLLARGEKVAILDLDVTTPNIGEVEGIETFTAGVSSILTKKQIKKLIVSVVGSFEDGWLLIDTPPTISALYSAITETIKNAKFLFVTTPSKNAIIDTSVGIKFFAQRGVIAIGIIQNMIGDIIGEAIDTESIMGVKTIGKIPLTKDTSKYFVEIVDNIQKIEFDGAYTKSDEVQIMSTLAEDDILRDCDLPLKFYNLETWDLMRQMIIRRDSDGFASNAKSHYDISTEKLEKIIKKGSSTTIIINSGLAVENAPLPYEIQEAEIIYDGKYSKGLPMFRLRNGVTLWHHECQLADDRDISDALDQGGFDIGDGRIIQSLFIQMYLNRAFQRDSIDSEKALIERHIKETGVVPKIKYIIYSVYTLEKDGDLEYDDFNMDEYVESNKTDYPDFHKHLLGLMELGTKD